MPRVLQLWRKENGMRYIDADAVIEKILKVRSEIPRTIRGSRGETINRCGDLMRGGLRKALRCVNDTKTADVVPTDQLRAIISGAICGACDVFPHGGMTQVECVSCILRHVKKVIGEEVQDEVQKEACCH